MRKLVAAILATCAVLAAPALARVNEMAPAPPPEAARAQLAAAIAHPSRIFDRRRDGWRHPSETLQFFRVEPGMTVVDYIPAKGWYTRVLVPYLGAQGRYIGAHPAARGPKRVSEYFSAQHEAFAATVAQWTIAGAPIEAVTSDRLGGAMAGSVDRVLIIREMHNLAAGRLVDHELAAIRKALKDDGLLGIVQHRARADASHDGDDGSLGYMREEHVIALVEKAGFRLVAKSEVNANPKDTADHPNGVWDLPPVWCMRDARMQAIGESDRMTLLFAKR